MPERLADQPWPTVAERGPCVVLVPLGSCEQHGPHLPLDTDRRIADAVAEGVAQHRGDVVIAPAVAYGASGEHAGFAGTLSIGTDVLAAVLIELTRSAIPDPDRRDPFLAVVFVNGHGGNVAAVRNAVDLAVGEGRRVSAWSPSIPDGDAHAGQTETSLLLAIAPEVVGAERPVGAADPVGELAPALRRGGVVSVSANGVLGDARGASAEEGRALLARLVADLVDHVEAIVR